MTSTPSAARTASDDTKPLHYFDQVREDVLALVPVGTRRLLDVGCAAGATAAVAKERFAIPEVWGIEGDPEAAGRAALRLDRVLEGDVETLDVPAPPGHFDCILCADILEHTRDPWTLLRGLRPLLAPRGALIVSLPNLRHVRPLALLLLDRFEYEAEGILDRTHLRFFTPRTMRALLEGAGFSIERVSANYSRSWRHDAAVFLTLGLLRPFMAYQILFVARRTPD
jgi:2-polyprenyl-3-methyl-5-hydroxy-6-metoxy-1,4-benzoquinol methylase